MKFSTNDFLYATSYALDCIETEVLGTTRYHSKRTGYIASMLGENLGMSEIERLNTASCAMLHDNALTEYMALIRGNDPARMAAYDIRSDFGPHCEMGERNLMKMPFYKDCRGVVLYHHEQADGTGPFKKHPEEIPLAARLIHLADNIDSAFALGNADRSKYENMKSYVSEHTGTFFDKESAEVFLDSISYDDVCCLNDEDVSENLRASLPVIEHDYSTAEIMSLSEMFAQIIDYKSRFTRTHSIGVAEKAVKLARYYGYDEESTAQLYLAGALHDIGKLAVDLGILEKPGKLTDEEFSHIKTHVSETHKILSLINGFGVIDEWASLHHEKLDGSGYPFGKTGDELCKNDRMLACIDIYQALIEERPYRAEMPHAKAMKILFELADDGKIDSDIVHDIDVVFAK